MKLDYERDEKKNEKLKEKIDRGGYGFEDVVEAIESWSKVEIASNKSKKYKGQKMFLVEIEWYIYCVPFEMRGKTFRLITIFPNRKYTKKLLP